MRTEEVSWRGRLKRILQVGPSHVSILDKDGCQISACWEPSDILGVYSSSQVQLHLRVPGPCGLCAVTRVFEIQSCGSECEKLVEAVNGLRLRSIHASNAPSINWVIAVHGGAGVTRAGVARRGDEPYLALMHDALKAGAAVLRRGGPAIDAAEAAVCLLEDSPLVNAGRGSVFAADGTHEMEACVVEGNSRAAGAVLGLRTTRHPIRGARAVMERSPHVALYGCDAWLRQQGLEQCAPGWFDTHERRAQLEAAQEREREQKRGQQEGTARDRKSAQLQRTPRQRHSFVSSEQGRGAERWLGACVGAVRRCVALETTQGGVDVFSSLGRGGGGTFRAQCDPASGSGAPGAVSGTVGAVVLDSSGVLVAASSTGGMTNKWPGRIGDAPCIGAGTFASPSCAVACSGDGEQFLRHSVGSTVGEMVRRGAGLGRACESVLLDQLRPGDGGLIAVGANGDAVAVFTTEGMFHGLLRQGDEKPRVGIWDGARCEAGRGPGVQAHTLPPPSANPVTQRDAGAAAAMLAASTHATSRDEQLAR